MTPNHSQFSAAQRFQAELALEGTTDTERVHFALKLMLDIKDVNAIGALAFAARQMGQHATTLNDAQLNPVGGCGPWRG